jgi:hypothetical protein
MHACVGLELCPGIFVGRRLLCATSDAWSWCPGHVGAFRATCMLACVTTVTGTEYVEVIASSSVLHYVRPSVNGRYGSSMLHCGADWLAAPQ